MNDSMLPEPIVTTKAQLLDAVPRLRAFALSLCGKPDLADDLVQETLMKAWSNLESFQPDTKMAAWLYTILRNEFYTRLRKLRREVEDPEGALAAQLVTRPAQEVDETFREFRSALFTLPPDQREALMLVGASGMTYEEAAEICACAVGTIKSRVNRARKRLTEMLHIDGSVGFDDDPGWRSIGTGPVGTT